MSVAHPYKLCPECRVEYMQTATRCADCDVDLVHADEIVEEEVAVEEFPPASELACVRVAPIAWIRTLSEALQARGHAHRVEPGQVAHAPEGQRPEVFGNVGLFGLYVRAEDLEAARELDGRIAAQLLPDEAPELAAGEAEACPACGTALPATATECADCGLGFG